MTTDVRLETATVEDVSTILQLIKALAEYQSLQDEVVADEALLRASLFGSRPAAEVVLAYVGEQPVGFAVYFSTFSTFLGRSGIHLEDLFVRHEWRGHGVGRRLLARIAAIAVERGCGRVEWAVLDWNEPAIGFYRRIGARPLDESTTYRLSGQALEAAAEL